MDFYRHRGKRLFDVMAVILSAPLWMPVIGVLALLVRFKLGRPVFFRQCRAGYEGASIQIIKLRSMTEGRDAQGHLLPDAARLTPFGEWLRRSSLDELPELFNVLRGEMSLVGPRPLHERYLDRYSSEQARRHEVCPGITGWAQVNGRNALSWEDKFLLDVWYVDHFSWWLDCRILARTVLMVVYPEGISAVGDATMPEFMGSSVITEPKHPVPAPKKPETP